MLCYIIICYVMICYVMLCHVMLCYAMLCYVMLCYYDIILYYIILYYIILYYIILYQVSGHVVDDEKNIYLSALDGIRDNSMITEIIVTTITITLTAITIPCPWYLQQGIRKFSGADGKLLWYYYVYNNAQASRSATAIGSLFALSFLLRSASDLVLAAINLYPADRPSSRHRRKRPFLKPDSIPSEEAATSDGAV